MNLDLIRQQIREQRRQLTSEEVELRSKKIAENFLSSAYYQTAKKIACYMAVDGEVSCQYTMERIFADNKQCYLPVVHPNKKGLMYFVEHQAGEALQENKFGILEPINNKNETEIGAIDIVLSPLVAYDHHGNRLGLGAGYYDRALENKKEKPVFCGLAYAFQAQEKLNANAWDVKLALLVNEYRIIDFMSLQQLG